jgi:hypothetical protein
VRRYRSQPPQAKEKVIKRLSAIAPSFTVVMRNSVTLATFPTETNRGRNLPNCRQS